MAEAGQTKAGIPPVAVATFWMVGTLASFSIMATAGRELSLDGFNTFQILFWRSIVGLFVVAALLTRFGWHHARTGQPRMQVFRNLVHFGGQFFWFYAISTITLQEVFALEFTTPIWTLAMAALFLGERITPVRVFAVILGFIGVLVVLRPGLTEVSLGHFSALSAAVCYASAYVLTKQLLKTDSPLAVLFYMTMVQLPLALALSLEDWKWPDWQIAPWIALVGVSALSAHYCISRALQLVDASIVVPMDFLRLPLVAVVGALFYAEAIDFWVFLGALIIVTGNLLNTRAENRKSRTAETKT